MLILQKELKIRSFFISRTLYNFSRFVFVGKNIFIFQACLFLEMDKKKINQFNLNNQPHFFFKEVIGRNTDPANNLLLAGTPPGPFMGPSRTLLGPC